MPPVYELWSDASCNGDRCGWGAVIQHHGKRTSIKGTVKENVKSTRMELIAAYEAVRSLAPLRGAHITLKSDCDYVVSGLKVRMELWREAHWKNKYGCFITDYDLWIAFWFLLNDNHVVLTVLWVKGHHKDPLNKLADRLAREGAGKTKRKAKCQNIPL